MEENYQILQEVLLAAMKFTVEGTLKSSWDFYGDSKSLYISIDFLDGLTKSWKIKIENKVALEQVLRELKSIDSSSNIDEFLGE